MFHWCRNQVVGFYKQNVWKTPVEEWYFASKNQLPCLSINGTLVENRLIRLSSLNIRSKIWQQWITFVAGFMMWPLFFDCFLAVPRPTLGRCWGGNLTDLILITASDSWFDSKVTGSLVTWLGLKAWQSA